MLTNLNIASFENIISFVLHYIQLEYFFQKVNGQARKLCVRRLVYNFKRRSCKITDMFKQDSVNLKIEIMIHGLPPES